MRRVGIGGLGLVGGVLLALIVQDLLAVAFLQNGTIPVAMALLIGCLIPAFAVLGAVLAILIESRHSLHRPQNTTDEEGRR